MRHRIAPVLGAYRTEIAEQNVAKVNRTRSHPANAILAKNRKKRDPKKNAKKIEPKRKIQSRRLQTLIDKHLQQQNNGRIIVSYCRFRHMARCTTSTHFAKNASQWRMLRSACRYDYALFLTLFSPNRTEIASATAVPLQISRNASSHDAYFCVTQ